MNDLSVIEKEFGDLSRCRECPPFWVPTPEQATPFIESLKDATIHTIGRSAGGREIVAIEYGEKDPLDTQTDNLHSALAGEGMASDTREIYPEAFYGARRRKPVVAFQGAIHGGELTGTVASLNLCKVIETGKDLRGKTWSRLADLARSMRICIIPWLNPDGTARAVAANPTVAPRGLLDRLTQGVASDGTLYTYPAAKRIQIDPKKTAYMGTYYNDNGVNLQYDVFTVERQPETIAWMKYYLEERPDGVVMWHCNAGSFLGPPEYYLPPGMQGEIYRLAGAVRSRLLREGFDPQRAGRMSWQLPGLGKHIFDQMTGTYHVCGATPLLCEMPSGSPEYPCTCDEMLDMGLITIEEILFYADTDGLRAYELWQKVKKRMADRSSENENSARRRNDG